MIMCIPYKHKPFVIRSTLESFFFTPYSAKRNCSDFGLCSKGADFRKLLKSCMKSFPYFTATVTAGHILHVTIKAELNPVDSEITSISSK